MAYQNVGKPRFYINYVEYLASTGIDIDPIFRTLPVGNNLFPYPPNSDLLEIPQLPDFAGVLGAYNNAFGAVLGHNVTATSFSFQNISEAELGSTNIINAPSDSDVQLSGFSIFGFVPPGVPYYFTLGDNEDLPDFASIGSLVMGSYYEMPNAPNLSLTMSREYGGTKEFTTYNGSSMSNTMWNKPPKWGELGAWELSVGNPSLAKSGRRTWDLEFSYMDDADLWGSNQLISTVGENITTELGYESEAIDSDTAFKYTLLGDDNFFSQVWHKTLGGTIPFIFQPDNTNPAPDQFAICRFKNNSLKAAQSSFNTYDISLSIEEVW